MPESPVIIRNQEKIPAEDYVFLREAGIKFIEQLGHKLWTDYNVHDPGITILEVFCFALTDLGYRTSYAMKDLLTRDVEGVPESAGRFHTAREIFSCNPVTFDDLRKLLVDIRGVRNAWIVKDKSICYYLDTCFPSLSLEEGDEDTSTEGSEEEIENRWLKLPPLNGLFEVLLEYEEFVRELKVGVDNIACVKGNYIPVKERGLSFEVYSDITLREVSIYADNSDPITIELINANGDVINRIVHYPQKIRRKEYITLNFKLTYDRSSNNIYKLIAKGDNVLFAHAEKRFQEDQGFFLDGYIKLIEGIGLNTSNVDPDTYYFFYDWEIELPSFLGTSWLTKRTHLGLENSFGSNGMPITPEDQAIIFDVINTVKLESVCIYAIGKGSIDIVLIDDLGEEVYYKDEHGNQQPFRKKQLVDNTSKNDQSIEVVLNWQIPPCQGYRLQAEVVEGSVQLFMNESGEFPHVEPDAMVLLGGTKNGDLTQQYFFFYDWIISYELKALPELPDEELTSGHVKSEVRRRLRLHRNLCEESVRVKPVETEEIGLYADVEFEGDSAEEVLAEIYCRLEEYVKPSVKYYTWQQLMEKGLPADDAFSGPLLNHGFIDDDEFGKTNRKKELRTSDIVQLLMDIPEVTLVKNIYLASFIDGRLAKKEEWILCLEVDDCLAANFSIDRSGLSLYRGNIPYQCNPGLLADLLEEKRIQNRQVKLKDHQLDCPVPIGEDKDLDDFYPIQNDLPITYLVGQNRIPDSSTPQRRAQANQLKAFLMFFEQMLGNYLAQLEYMPSLFSWDLPLVRDQIQTYFTQEVDEIVDLDKIYQSLDTLPDDLHKIIEAPEDARVRKNKFLDHLLARFAEDFSTYSTLMYTLISDKKEAALRIIEDKSEFFKHYPDISRNRAVGLSFNYIKNKPDLSGYQRRIYRKLGMYRRDRIYLDQDGMIIQRETGKGWRFQIVQDGQILFESIYMPSREALDNLIDLLIHIGKDQSFYIKSEEVDKCWMDEGNWVLVSPCKPGDKYEPLGVVKGFDPKDLDAVISYFQLAQRPKGYSQPAELSFDYLTSNKITIESETDADGNEKWYFKIRDERENLLFTSVSCESRFFIEELLEEAFKVGIDWDNYQISEDSCSWELYACKGKETSLIGTSNGLLIRKTLRDLFDRLCHVEGMHLIEHILLRPRLEEDPFMNVQFHTVDKTENCYTEEGKPIFVADPYSFRMSLILPAWSSRFTNLQFRRFAENIIRLEAPAHIYANIYWLSFSQMQEFEKVYMAWCIAFSKLPDHYNGKLSLLKIDKDLNDDWEQDESLKNTLLEYQNALKALIDFMQKMKVIYPQAQLYDQSNQQDGATQLTLGNMSLGNM